MEILLSDIRMCDMCLSKIFRGYARLGDTTEYTECVQWRQ